MLRKGLLGVAVIGSAMIGLLGTAHAGPTATVDGVTFPVGIVLGGNQIQSGILDQTLITNSGQTLQSVGIVNAIATPSLSSVWSNGQNGIELAFIVNNYVSNVVTFPTVTFTGGQATFYALPAGTAITGYGSVAADIAAIQAASLGTFLTVKGVAEDASGDTLVSSILVGTSLSAFSAADGSGFLDVTGGDASGYFGTQSFANAFDTTGFSDFSLTSDFSTSSTDVNFGVSGSVTLKGNAVPEPFSLGILGLGLVAVGVTHRRRG
jgi:hypothetical protein